MVERVDFDDYADRYEGMLQDQLAFFSADRGYFSEYKVMTMRANGLQAPRSILDFGCGIGLTLPYLQKHFPQASLYATDISRKSLDHVASHHPGVTALADADVDAHRFDLILLAGVLHHVPPAQRPALMERLARLLTPEGSVYVFEHNPYNPVTRRMVSTCPFDQDAHLLSRRDLLALMAQSGALKPKASGYCLFFPERLGGLRRLEPALRWLPLGGQYFVRAAQS